MRIIKFRAISLETGKWAYGSLVPKDDGYYILCSTSTSEYFIKVDPETIGQFLGMCDVNGNEIYEDDIITEDRYPFYNDGELNYIGEVVWFENTFSFGYILRCVNTKVRGISDGIPEDIEEDMELKIIGNIYDNPEILNYE